LIRIQGAFLLRGRQGSLHKSTLVRPTGAKG
jgi:hypothetical protein